MKTGLVIAGIFTLAARAANDTSLCPTTTYTVPLNICLYVCPPKPTITYTSTSYSTVNIYFPCATIAPSPEVKRAADPITCSPAYTVTRAFAACTGCATTAPSKTTVVTTTSTVTSYHSCSTPTSTASSTTAPPKSTTSICYKC